MANRWNERESAIMNGIMSVVLNECDALECAKKEGPQAVYELFACKVRPTLQVCAEEQKQFQEDNAALRDENGTLRITVETVIANQHVAPEKNDVVMAALRAAAPGHAFL